MQNEDLNSNPQHPQKSGYEGIRDKGILRAYEPISAVKYRIKK